MKLPRIKVGVAQMASVLGDIDANLEIVADFVEQSRRQSVELLVFPETALCGYAAGPGFHEAAVRPHSSQARRLAELSRDVDLAIGLIEETEDHQFYNSALYLSQGHVRHLHRKIYLPTYRMFDEKRYFGAGWSINAFDTRWGRMAMLICADAWHLTLPYLAAHDGADILLILAASPVEGLTPTIPSDEAWMRMNRSYALTLSSFVVFANQAGQSNDLRFWGGSHIVLPDGNLLAESQTDQQDLLVAEVDLTVLRNQRMILPFRRDDSLPFTLEEGRRILRSKLRRRDGFYSEVPKRETCAETGSDAIAISPASMPPIPAREPVQPE